jgi:hypothetical protein
MGGLIYRTAALCGLMRNKLLALILAILFSSQAFAGKIDLPKDSDGWTIFTPSSDTRIVYIDTIANGASDTTCVAYDHDDALIGADPFAPTGAITRCATYAKAKTLTTTGNPDWILYKRGEIFREIYPQGSFRSGRSETEPSLVSAYGASGALPSIRTPISPADQTAYFWASSFGSLNYWAWANLEYYIDYVDPDADAYGGRPYCGYGYSDVCNDDPAGKLGLQTAFIYTNTGYTKHSWLWEGIKFRHVTFNVQTSESAATVTDLTLRRCSFTDAWKATAAVQGIFDGLLFEENVLDHNGWFNMTYPESITADRTRNHNLYITPGDNSSFLNNISSRASNMAYKIPCETGCDNLAVTNNLAVNSNLGMGLASNRGDIDYRFSNGSVTYNVFANIGDDNISKQGPKWVMHADGMDDVDISYNLEVDTSTATNGYRSFLFWAGTGVLEGWSNDYYRNRNVTIHNNIWAHLGADTSEPIYYSNDIMFTNVTFSNNIFDMRNSSPAGFFFFDVDNGTLTETDTLWSGNTYSRANTLSFKWPTNTSTSLTEAQWVTQEDATASFSVPTYPDSTRTLKTYMSAQGEDATLDAFYEKIRAQDRYNWDTTYTATAINDWIRAGYFSDLTPVECDSAHRYLCTVDNCETTGEGYWRDDFCYATEEVTEATCTDGVMNGDETGIDCGGSCPDACEVVIPTTSSSGAVYGAGYSRYGGYMILQED